MSTRTYQELLPAVRQAMNSGDVGSLHDCAAELKEIGTPEAVATAAQAEGWAAFVTGDYRLALELFGQALSLFEEIGDRMSATNTIGNIASVHTNSGDHATSLEYAFKALASYEELGNLDGVGNITGNIGLTYLYLGEYPKALDFLHRSLSVFTDLHAEVQAARALVNIGGVYYFTGDYPSALEHFHKALAIQQEHKNKSGIASSVGNMGSLYSKMGRHEEALKCFQQALEICNEIGDRRGVAINTGNIGSAYTLLGDHSEGLAYARQARTLFEEIGDRNGTVRLAYNIVDNLISLGHFDEAEAAHAEADILQVDEASTIHTRESTRARIMEHRGQLQDAAEIYHRALENVREHSLVYDEAWLHKQLRDLCQRMNDFAGYIEHNNEYVRITELHNGKDTAAKITMQEMQREINARELEHQKHMAVLHSTLPKHIADRVARGEVVNDHYDNASVIFLDIVGFTTLSEQLTSDQLVQLLEQLFTTLDAVCEKHDVVKIKTIGDSYMAVAFPRESSNNELRATSPEQRAASAALDMLREISHIVSPIGFPIQARIGMHCGAVTAGVIGTTRMQYDVWGDTVNVASRMESTSEPGRIHVSSSFAIALSLRPQDLRLQELRPQDLRLQDCTSSPFPVPSSLIPRGELEIKGKGMMTTYWLESV